MSELDTTEMTWYQRNKTRVMLAAGTAGVTLAPYVSAGTLNTSVSPLITDVAELFTPILTLVIAAVPVIIATGMIGFILGVLAAILSKLRI
jgi:hypothetical protein